jgi:hypothetical protein
MSEGLVYLLLYHFRDMEELINSIHTLEDLNQWVTAGDYLVDQRRLQIISDLALNNSVKITSLQDSTSITNR